MVLEELIKVKKLSLILLVLPLVLSGCLLQESSGLATSPSPVPTSSTSTTTAPTLAPSLPAASTSTSFSPTSQATKIEPVLLPPLENKAPNSTYQPYFAGQTRAAGTKTQTAIKTEIITDKLTSPWAVASLPDGRLIITEKAGYIRLVSLDGQLGPRLGGLPDLDDRNQGGLLDLALDPDFASSRLLFMTLAERTRQGSATALAQARLADQEDSLEDFTIIWRALPYYNNSMHFGSRLVFDEEGYIFVSTGERSDLATRPLAQDMSSAYGKIVKLTRTGQPAPDNPFLGQADVLAEIYSVGHRNGQGLAIQPGTGQLWQSEMGPRGGDELNLIKPGGNYGWPLISYGLEYSGKPVGPGQTVGQGLEQPVYYWDPVLAPSGMTFYTGLAIPEWENNLFIAGLASQHIARLIIEDERVIAEERLLADEGQRFRDVTAGLDGALYVVTDAGRLYKISAK